MRQKYAAGRPFTYCGQDLDVGQVLTLTGSPNDDRLIGLGYLTGPLSEDEQAVVCLLCGAPFRAEDALRRHQRAHHAAAVGAAQPVSVEVAQVAVESATLAAKQAKAEAIAAACGLRDLQHCVQIGLLTATDPDLVEARQTAAAAQERLEHTEAALARAQAVLRTAQLLEAREQERSRKGRAEARVVKEHPDIVEKLQQAERAYAEALSSPVVEGQPTAVRIGRVESAKSRLTAARATYERACFEAEA